MTRHLLPLLAVLLVSVVAAAMPHSVMAGGYDVIACNQTVAGGANHSWATSADGGMTALHRLPGRARDRRAHVTGSESAAQRQPHALARHR